MNCDVKSEKIVIFLIKAKSPSSERGNSVNPISAPSKTKYNQEKALTLQLCQMMSFRRDNFKYCIFKV